jgi:hypothetical protein
MSEPEDDPVIRATVNVPRVLVETMRDAAFVAYVHREMSKGLQQYFDAYCDEMVERMIQGSNGPSTN